MGGGAGDCLRARKLNVARLRAVAALQRGIESHLRKNNSYQYQCLERIVQHIPSSPSHLPSYLPRCSHGDRVINRHSGERAAYGSAGDGYRRGRSPLAMSLLAFARSYRSVPCASPGKKPLQGVWRATLFEFFQTAGPHALYVPSQCNGQTGNGAWQRGGLPCAVLEIAELSLLQSRFSSAI